MRLLTILLAAAPSLAVSLPAQSTGVLLGYGRGDEYRTMWLVMRPVAARLVADVPELIVPRSTGFWRVSVATLCEDGTRQVVWQAPIDRAPLVPGPPCPVADSAAANSMATDTAEPAASDTMIFTERIDCDASEAAILFVSPRHIAERYTYRQTEFCEPRGWRFRDDDRVRSLDSETPIDLRTVLGTAAAEAYAAAIAREFRVTSRENNCVRPRREEYELTSWSIEHRRGAWRAIAAHNESGLCEWASPIELPLPASVSGERWSHGTWPSLRAAIPALQDWFSSPTGEYIVAVTEPEPGRRRLLVHAMRGDRPGRTLLDIPYSSHHPIVMAQWARGRHVATWTGVMERIGAHPLPPVRQNATRPGSDR